MDELCTPAEWSRRYGIVILDPDGWREPNGRSFEDRISKEEFEERMFVSTTGPVSGLDTRPTEDNWALGVSDEGEAPCGCRVTAQPSITYGGRLSEHAIEEGKGWLVLVYACEDHRHDVKDASLQVTKRMLERYPDATLSALLASVLEEIGKR